LRNKREGIFATLSKLINKFISFLLDHNIKDISEPNVISSNKENKEKSISLQSKITDYLRTYKEI